MVETVGSGRSTSEITNSDSKTPAVQGGPRVAADRVDTPVGTANERRLVDSGPIVRESLFQQEASSRRYDQIQGVKGNPNVTPAFLTAVESMAARLGARPEHLLATMSFETGGTFSPSITNGIGATGLIQFLPSTARGLGTTTEVLRNMTAIDQLSFVEKYFERFAGRLDSLEKVYTAVLSGSPKSGPNDVLFRAGTRAYDLNPLDWNIDGVITAGEATTPVAARMVGGVRAVQQALIDRGVVPAADAGRFADGGLGPKTAAALALYQQRNGLAATGNLDDATASRLFNLVPAAPVNPRSVPASPTGLAPGQNGPAVIRLQDLLIRFGQMSAADKATGPGIFGPRTENSLQSFQQNAGTRVTGVFDSATIASMDKLLAGVRKGERSDLVNSMQSRLVALGFMTAGQKATGPGIFGSQTDASLRRFQAANGLKNDGILGPRTFSALFGSQSSVPAASTTPTAPFIPAGRTYDVSGGATITNELAPVLATIAVEYTRQTGGRLTVTSGYRGPDRQASAMNSLIERFGTDYVRNLYANKTAVGEIINAYGRGGVAEMTRVIEGQVARGIYISSHLRSRAFDVGLGVNERILQDIVTQNNGRFLRESDHVHIQF